jgi:hypothetical protein
LTIYKIWCCIVTEGTLLIFDFFLKCLDVSSYMVNFFCFSSWERRIARHQQICIMIRKVVLFRKCLLIMYIFLEKCALASLLLCDLIAHWLISKRVVFVHHRRVKNLLPQITTFRRTGIVKKTTVIHQSGGQSANEHKCRIKTSMSIIITVFLDNK